MSLSQAAVPLSFPGDAGLGVLLPYLAGLAVEETVTWESLVCCRVRSVSPGARCPGCGTWSGKPHDSYWRRLADAGIGGRRVVIRLLVRRLACGNPGCPKKTFAERFPLLAGPGERKTLRLASQLAETAAALGGRAGTRLARSLLAAEVSRHWLVRSLLAEPDPPAAGVRVLGVDDFSLRRGRSYATILVDMEAGTPVDVLPDREGATLEAWLRAHPGTEVICRDRGGAYADAARKAAPAAVQAADRWHLWHNLCEHARDAVARHRDCLAGHCACPGAPGETGQAPRQEPAPASLAPGAVEAVIRDRHARVAALRAEGLDMPAAADRLGLPRRITRQYWNAPGPGTLLAGIRDVPGLRPWEPFIREHWTAGHGGTAALHRALAARGCAVSGRSLGRYCAPLRLAMPAKPPAPPSPRQVTRWIATPAANLPAGDAAALTALTGRCPALAALTARVSAFARIITGLEGKDALDTWLSAAENDPALPEMSSFAAGIRMDYDAVAAGCTLTWNSGLVEGLNTRTKYLKRQMYGRAAFRLLRKRILHHHPNHRPPS